MSNENRICENFLKHKIKRDTLFQLHFYFVIQSFMERPNLKKKKKRQRINDLNQ